jgi:hypothetical protein
VETPQSAEGKVERDSKLHVMQREVLRALPPSSLPTSATSTETCLPGTYAATLSINQCGGCDIDKS